MATTGEEAGAAAAGLDLVSGVFGYLASQQNASMAGSRADLIRTEALANADRYSERAAHYEAQEKVMYLASGVKLAGSPVDALATTANNTQQDINAILMGGEEQAMNEQIAGVNAEMKGRDALLEGINTGLSAGLEGYGTSLTKQADVTGVGIMASMLSRAGK